MQPNPHTIDRIITDLARKQAQSAAALYGWRDTADIAHALHTAAWRALNRQSELLNRLTPFLRRVMGQQIADIARRRAAQQPVQSLDAVKSDELREEATVPDHEAILDVDALIADLPADLQIVCRYLAEGHTACMTALLCGISAREFERRVTRLRDIFKVAGLAPENWTP